MSGMANIVVYDGASTPIAHTLVPISSKTIGDVVVALWREQLPTLPIEAQVYCEMKQRTLKSGVVETRTRVVFPVMESISGQNAAGYTAAPKVAYSDANEWVNYAHPRSTIAGKRIAKQALTNLSNNIATTVAAATSGVFDEANVQTVMPT